MEKPPHPPTYEEACSSQLQSPTVVEGTSSHAGRAPTGTEDKMCLLVY